MKARWIVFGAAAALAAGAGLQALNDRLVREAVCGPDGQRCAAGSTALAFEQAWPLPAPPDVAPAPVLRTRGSTALLRRACDGGWTLAFGARVDVDPVRVGEWVDAGGGCLDLGRSRSSGAMAPVRLRQGGCAVVLAPVTLDWHQALELRVEARVAPEAAAACAGALGGRLDGAGLGSPAQWQLALQARFALAQGDELALDPASPAGWLRQVLERLPMSHRLKLAGDGGSLTLGLDTRPAAGAAVSPELTLSVAADGRWREHLPAELALPADGHPLRLRWNIDHDTGVLHRQEQPVARLAPPPRPAAPVDPAAECRAPRAVPLHMVEADDRGRAVDPAQLSSVLAAVDAAQAQGGALVSVFVHGWQHSAAVGDSYVCDFAALLHAVDDMERHAARAAGRPPRRVLGVYVGWPGRLYADELANLTTFWNRLQVADRLGGADGVLRPLLLGLAQRVAAGARDPRPDRRSGLVVTGHSMGGRAVFHAVKDSFDRAAPGKAPLSPDLVLLVNPAFSAAQYRALHERTRQCLPLPVPMLLFSSEADAVTRQVYPAGQAVTFDEARRRRVPFIEHAYTAANFEEFVTHRLGFELLQGPPPDPHGPQSILRGFERVPAGSRELLQDDPVTVFRQPAQGRPTAADAWYRMRTVAEAGAPAGCAATRSRVVKVDRRILPDHGTIFTPAFMEVVIRLFNRTNPS